jgi:hypothetical protein
MAADVQRNGFGEAGKDVVSQKGRYFAECGCGAKCGRRLAVSFVIIRKWSEALQRWMMWCGCVDKSKVGGV